MSYEEEKKNDVFSGDGHDVSVLPAIGNANNGDLAAENVHERAGLAAVQQIHLIPSAGERKICGRVEFWCYCLYSIGVTGVGIGNFGSAQNQNLLQQAFPNLEMVWGGRTTSTDSFILDLNGIIFAVQLCLLLVLGPYADYGTWRPWILMTLTVFGIAVSFAFMGLYQPSDWQAVAALYVFGTILFNVANSFYLGAFPTLVRDLPQMMEAEQEVNAGTKHYEDYAKMNTLERSKISNYVQAVSSVGSAVGIAIGVGIAAGVGQATVAENNKTYAMIVGFFGAVWLVTSIPWFLAEKRRAGQKLPDNTPMLLAGPKQVWSAAKSLPQLKQTFLYLAGYFLIVDCYSTAGTLVNILQNDAIAFSAYDFSGLYIVVYGVSFFGYLTMSWVQRRFNIPPKYMFMWAAFWICFECLWGVIGIWTHKIGYHNEWEFWWFQAFLGAFTPGLFSYAPVVLAEVVPAPKMFLFFALYNSVGQTSSFIGPFISGAIINAAGGNANYSFWFTFGTGIIGFILVACVNVDKAKQDCVTYLEKERRELYSNQLEIGSGEMNMNPIVPSNHPNQ